MSVSNQLASAFETRRVEMVALDAVDAAWLASARGALPAAGESFAASMLGAAALISNLDDFAELRAGAPVIAVTMITWTGVWTFWIAGLLSAASSQRPLHVQRFLRDGYRLFPRFILVAALTVVVAAISAGAHAFSPTAARPILLLLAIAMVGVTTVVASYARAYLVLHAVRVPQAFGGALRFVRLHPGRAAAHFAVFVVIWSVALAVVAVVDITAGAIDHWSYLLAGQLYIVWRFITRVIWDVSVLELVRGSGA